jgi:hypothetical protein
MSPTFSHDIGDHWRALSSEPCNPIMCPPHRKHLPHLLEGFSHLSRKRAQIFSFSPCDKTPYSTNASFNFSHMIYTVGRRTHAHTVPDVCRKLNQKLHLNSPPPPMTPTFILLYQIYPSMLSTLPHRLTSPSTRRTNTRALSSPSSQLIIISLKTKI